MANTTEVPRNLSNKQIRKFARELTRLSYGKLLAVITFSSLPTVLYIILTSFINVSEIDWESSLFYIFFTPLTIGTANFFYETYVYGKSKLSRLFYFFTKKKLLLTSLMLGFVNQLVTFLIQLTNYGFSYLSKNTNFDIFPLSCLAIFVLFVFCYLFFRFFLIYYIFGQNTERNIRTIISESLCHTRSWYLDFLWFSIMAGLWLIIPIIFLYVQLRLYIPSEYLRELIYLILFFFGPYIQILSAGYAHKLLPNPNAKKKRSKKESNDTIS